MLGPKARHEARRGTAWEARHAVLARTPTGRACPMPVPYRTGAARLSGTNTRVPEEEELMVINIDSTEESRAHL